MVRVGTLLYSYKEFPALELIWLTECFELEAEDVKHHTLEKCITIALVLHSDLFLIGCALQIVMFRCVYVSREASGTAVSWEKWMFTWALLEE